MSYEYAGSLFDSNHEDQMQCVNDWMTSHGRESTYHALCAYWDEGDYLAGVMHDDHASGGWEIVGLAQGCDASDIADLLEKWEEWARRHAMWEIRDDLVMSQGEFAELLRLSGQERISEYERGVRVPSKQVVMLAHYARRDA